MSLPQSHTTLLFPPPFENKEKCNKCSESFKFYQRRFHCRHCGKTFCSGCAFRRVAIPRFGYHLPVRVCDSCFFAITSDGLGEKGTSLKVASTTVQRDHRRQTILQELLDMDHAEEDFARASMEPTVIVEEKADNAQGEIDKEETEKIDEHARICITQEILLSERVYVEQIFTLLNFYLLPLAGRPPIARPKSTGPTGGKPPQPPQQTQTAPAGSKPSSVGQGPAGQSPAGQGTVGQVSVGQGPTNKPTVSINIPTAPSGVAATISPRPYLTLLSPSGSFVSRLDNAPDPLRADGYTSEVSPLTPFTPQSASVGAGSVRASVSGSGGAGTGAGGAGTGAASAAGGPTVLAPTSSDFTQAMPDSGSTRSKEGGFATSVLGPGQIGIVVGAASALASILNLHQSLHRDFGVATSVVSAFFSYCDHLKIYCPYVQLFTSLSVALSDLKNKKLQAFLEKAAKSHSHQSVHQLLIAPVQRLPRYVLLLDRLNSHMPAKHPDKHVVLQTLGKMKAVAELVDSSQKQSDNASMLLELQKKITGIPDGFRVLTPARLILRQGSANEVREGGTKRYDKTTAHRLILFNDCVMVLTANFAYLDRIDLLFADVAKGKRNTLTFLYGLHYKEERSSWICKNESARDSWYTVTKQAIANAQEMRNNYYRRHKNRRSTTSMSSISGSLSVTSPSGQGPGPGPGPGTPTVGGGGGGGAGASGSIANSVASPSATSTATSFSITSPSGGPPVLMRQQSPAQPINIPNGNGSSGGSGAVAGSVGGSSVAGGSVALPVLRRHSITLLGSIGGGSTAGGGEGSTAMSFSNTSAPLTSGAGSIGTTSTASGSGDVPRFFRGSSNTALYLGAEDTVEGTQGGPSSKITSPGSRSPLPKSASSVAFGGGHSRSNTSRQSVTTARTLLGASVVASSMRMSSSDSVMAGQPPSNSSNNNSLPPASAPMHASVSSVPPATPLASPSGGLLNALVGDCTESVNIFMRVRPFVLKEEFQDGRTCVSIEGNMAVLTVSEGAEEGVGGGLGGGRGLSTLPTPGHSYIATNISDDFDDDEDPCAFGSRQPTDKPANEKVVVYDEVFGPSSTQEEVFQRVGQEILGALLAGYNASVIAYGHTGAGKTYTMFGETDDPLKQGLIPRILTPLFDVFGVEDGRTPQESPYEAASIEISYIQVYNNTFQDLLAVDGGRNDQGKYDKGRLKLQQKTDGKSSMSGVCKVQVFTAPEALALIEIGNKQVVRRAHGMNQSSSRSHTVFGLHINAKKRNEKLASTMSLYMVDLAGSENVDDTMVDAEGKMEAHHIMKALTALARVIQGLSENQLKIPERRLPVPFKDSKLTQYLKDALTGSFVCSVMLNVSSSPILQQDRLAAKTMIFGEGARALPISAKRAVSGGSSQVSHWLKGIWNSVSASTFKEKK